MKILINDEYAILTTKNHESFKVGRYRKDADDEVVIPNPRYYRRLSDALRYVADDKLRRSDAEGFEEVAEKQEEIKKMLKKVREELEKGRP